MNHIQFLTEPAPPMPRDKDASKWVMNFRIDGVPLEQIARVAVPDAFAPHDCSDETWGTRSASLCGPTSDFVLLGGEHFLDGCYRDFAKEEWMRLPISVCESCQSIWCGRSLWTRFRRESGFVFWEGLRDWEGVVLHPDVFQFDASEYDAAFTEAREDALQTSLKIYQPAKDIQPACMALFRYACRFVTPALINAHCMNDPGLPKYVKEYMLTLRAGPPAEPSFYFWETFGDFTLRAGDYDEGGGRFACFLFSTVLAFVSTPKWTGHERSYHAEELTENLLGYGLALEDSEFLRLLAPAFKEAWTRLGLQDFDEFDFEFRTAERPYYTLARLILAHSGHAPLEDKSALLEQVIYEAREREWEVPVEHRWQRPTWSGFSSGWRRLMDATFSADYPLRILAGSDPPS